MYSFGSNNYRQRYNNNKFMSSSSSLSNVYKDMISLNKSNSNLGQNSQNSGLNSSNPSNYHFLNRSSNYSTYKSVSPPVQINSNVAKNFMDSYNNENKKDYYYKKENNRYDYFSNNYPYEKQQNNIRPINNTNSIRKNFFDTITGFRGLNTSSYDNNENYYNGNNNRRNNSENANMRNNNYNISTNRSDLNHYDYFNQSTINNKELDINKNLNKQKNTSFSQGKILSNNNYKNSYWNNKSPEQKNNYQNNLYKINSNVGNYNYTPIQLNRGHSLENIYEKNRLKNYNKARYKVSSYGSYTMAGTNGYGVTKTNQDSYLIKQDIVNSSDIEYTFGVFDGHGLQGHFVSQAIKQFFSNCSFCDFNTKPMLLSIFSSLSREINNSIYFDSMESGSTVILVHINAEKIISANCGDSRAILITKNKRIIPLSRDHKPDLPEEKLRIERSGGRIDKIYGMGPYRVWFKNKNYPGLAMSRSIGDGLAHQAGVSDIPEIEEFNIEQVEPLVLILASDGIWEFMTNDEVKNIAMNSLYNNKDANSCSRELVAKARQIWENSGYSIDDITCVVVYFNQIYF